LPLERPATASFTITKGQRQTLAARKRAMGCGARHFDRFGNDACDGDREREQQK